MNLGLTYNYMLRPEEGLDVCTRGMEFAARSQWLAACRAEAFVFLQDADRALAEIERALDNDPVDDAIYALCAVYLGLLGETGRVTDIQRVFEESAKTRWVSPLYFAYVSFGIGDYDAFFRFANQAIDEKAQFTPWLVHVPHFRSLHDDPRFAELVRRLDLPGQSTLSASKDSL